MATRYSKYLPAFVFLCDIFLLNLALSCAHIIINNPDRPQQNPSTFIFVLNLSWMIISGFTKNFRINRPLDLKENIDKFLVSIIYNLLIVSVAIAFLKFGINSFTQVLFSYSTFFLLVIISRLLLFAFLSYIRKRGYNHRQIVIIGDGNIAARLIDSFTQHPEYGYDLVNYISEKEVCGMPYKMLEEKLLKDSPDELFICYSEIDENLLSRLFEFADQNLIQIKVVSDSILDGKYAQLVNHHNVPLLQVKTNPEISKKILLLKRGFDIVFSVAVVIFGSPVFVALYFITKFTSEGPSFYKQERVGLNGKLFYIYKFRSMFVDSEKSGPQLSSANDARITKWGKIMRQTRLDELPQFWNVLKGDMSVVGPRPERQHYIEKIIARTPGYEKLFNIKPGLTSMGQIHYGYAENVDQMCHRVHYDLLYLQNLNLNADIDIILKTVVVMLQRKGK